MKFGYEADIHFDFKPLRVLSAVEEESVKTSRQTRYVNLYDRSLLDSKEMGDIMEKEQLVPIETAAQQGIMPAPTSGTSSTTRCSSTARCAES